MIAWLPGDGNADDIQGANHGTMQGDAAFAPGKIGQAFSFDGDGDYVDVPGTPQMSALDSITVEAWINPQASSTSVTTIFANRSPQASEGFSLFVTDSGRLSVVIRTENLNLFGASFESAASVIRFDDEFKHIAVTYDAGAGALKAYVDSAEVALIESRGDPLSGPLNNPNNFYIGRREDTMAEGASGAAYYKGLIDEVKVFDRALSPAEIQLEAGNLVVTSTNDSGPGSLRQAILDANATPGAQVISFHIPGAGVHTIAPLSALPQITETVRIDGYTQPGARPNTLAVGSDAVLLVELSGVNVSGDSGLDLRWPADNCVVRGLVINRFNNIGLDVWSSGNVIEGNFIGTDAAGAAALGNANGVQVISGQANNNLIGGTTPAARNVISGNRFFGIATAFFHSGTRIQGNYIGTNAAGMAALGNGLGGISLSNPGTVGGAEPGAGNVISSNGSDGVVLNASGSVLGNLIGTRADGTGALGNGNYGIAVGSSSVVLGGTEAGAGNTFAFNGRGGVAVMGVAEGVFVSGNSIYGNGGDGGSAGLGIDLGGDGLTPNDSGDGDPGPNRGQNFPTIDFANSNGLATTVQGTLDSEAGTAYVLHFYSNAECDPSGYGEGQTYLGSTTATTGVGAGSVSFSASFPVVVAQGQFITATATHPTNGTSEFSPCRPVSFTRPPDLQVSAMTAPPQVQTDAPFELAWTDANNGQETAAGPWTDKVFLSADDQLGDDTLLAEFPFGQSIEVGQSASRTQSVSIPRASVPQDGQYYLLVFADANNDVQEGSAEGNNLRAVPVTVNRALLPDLVVENIEAPPTAFFDQQITVRWFVKNVGNASTNASEWYDTLLLSSDTAASEDDAPQLDVLNVSYLNAGDGYTASAQVRVPRGLHGTFHLIVKTDSRGNVLEHGEDNNVREQAIELQISPLPDLQVSLVQAPDEAFPGQPMQLNWRVENRGTADTPAAQAAWVDSIYLSADQTLSPATDRLIGSREHTGGLAQGGGYTINSADVDVPSNIGGDWYVFVLADQRDAVYEFTGESNNANFDQRRPTHIRVSPPDLTVPDFTSSANATAGQAITVNWTVHNQGAFEAGDSWLDTVYLSADATPDRAADTPLATVVHNGRLGPALSYNASATVTLPPCVSGTNYLFVYTDRGNQVFEYDPAFDAEANNASQPRAIQVTLSPPDLQVTALSSATSATAGQPLSVSWTVRNSGIGAASQVRWRDEIYLSQSPVFGTQTALVAAFTHEGGLALNTSYTRTEDVRVPPTAQGTYYLFVRTDGLNEVPECAGEDNNIRAGAETVEVGNSLPDLSVTNIEAPTGAFAGQTITARWTVSNSGTADVRGRTSWKDSLFFSTDATLDSGDRPIGSVIKDGPLAAGESYAAQVQATIPNVAAGTYYLIAQTDSDQRIFEGQHEDNNSVQAVVSITVPDVDLQLTTLSAPGEAFSGQTVKVSWTVNSAGSRNPFTSQWTDYVLLSRDQILDTTDQVIAFEEHVGPLNAGQSYSPNADAQLPPGLSGQYYIFVRTDWHNAVAEANESNNDSSPSGVTLQLPPPVDLTVAAVGAPASFSPGEEATIEWTGQNVGTNATTGSWIDAVYLSTDDTWDNADALVGRVEHTDALAAGQTYTGTLTAAVPAVNLGQYYVIVRADVRNRVREVNEENNARASAAAASLDVPELPLGSPLNSTLRTGRERYFKTNAPANETLLYTLDAERDDISTEMYVRHGGMVSRTLFDFLFSQPNAADQEIVVPETATGYYYNLTRGLYVPPDAGGNTPFTIKAEIIPFSIRSVSPQRIGDNGQVTLTLRGAKFQPGATIQLTGNGTTLAASQVTILDSGTTAKARFVFTNAPHGTYDAVLTNPGNAFVTVPQAVAIETATRLMAETFGTADMNPRVGGAFRWEGGVRNIGNVDIPYLSVSTLAAPSLPISLAPPSDGLTFPTTAGDSNSTFLLREMAPGDSRTFSFTIRGFRERFDFSVVSVARSRQQYVAFLREISEGLRQQILSSPPATLPDEWWDALPSTDNWWTLLRGYFVQLELLDVSDGNPFSRAKVDVAKLANDQGVEVCINDVFQDHDRNQFGLNVGLILCAGGTGGVGAGFCAAGWGLGSGGNTADSLIKVCRCARDHGTPPPCGLRIETCNALGVEGISPSAVSGEPCPYVPHDPNDKIGPIGFNSQAFVGEQQPLPYTINFENVSTATAAAQRIHIVDQLDANLDWRTFRLREVGFGKYRISVPENRAFYQGRIQLGEDLGNLQADISAGVDIATGRVTWTLTVIDPATGEPPPGALQGLLPPNDETGRGQGFVSYTVKARPSAPTGTQILNSATIVFDTQEPITTNTVTNTLDADAPASAVAALPAESAPTFTLNWSGDDPADGSGLQSFDIWVSEDGGPYQPFVSGATETSAQFTGQPGRNYRFYSVARDNASNVETAPESPDAVTTVVTATPSANLSITKTASVNPAEVGRIFTYNITVTNAGPSAATNVVVTDALPAGVTFTSATPSQWGCALASGTLTCQLGSLAANASATVALQVKPRQTGILANASSVAAAEPDPDTSNNSATSNINVIKTADLKVAMSDSADPIFVGEQTTYTMLVTNLGPISAATGVTLTDSLPASMTFVSATTSQGSLVTPPVGSTGIITANMGSLAVNAQATVTVTVKAAQAGVVSNTSTVSSNETDTNTVNNTVTQATTVKAALLQKVLLAKQVLTGGCDSTTGNVYLTGPAPLGGVTVPLSSNVTGANVLASVFIPAGQTVSPAFNVTTSFVTAKQVGLVTAGSGVGSVSRGITINVGSGSCP